MNMKKTILSLVILNLILITGCKQYWYNEKISYERCRADYENCVKQMQTYADNDSRLSAYPEKFIQACMKEKGYTLVYEDDLPLRVKRKDPDIVEARYQGVAGKLASQPYWITQESVNPHPCQPQCNYSRSLYRPRCYSNCK